MNALLNPANRPRTGVRWPFVAHIVVMFSFVTVFNAIYLNMLSISNVDNREFTGSDSLPPGPLGYFGSLYSNANIVVSRVVFLLNHCLADGMLVSCISNLPLGWPTLVTPALSLLRYLWNELLGHCFPLPGVLCIFWYVPIPNRRRCSRLTPPT